MSVSDSGLTWQIRPEQAEDGPLVETLNAISFGPGRFAKSAYRLREGVDPVEGLSFVAVGDGGLLGSIRFWPIAVGMERSLLLGPLAVQPQLRGRGIGIALMKHAIAEARRLGHPSILLVGDEPYYVRVGFARLAPGRVKFPGPVDPARVLGLSLAQHNVMLTIKGEVRRPRVDHPVCACGADVSL
jgi:predicted N-acetyltransferase YhbS